MSQDVVRFFWWYGFNNDTQTDNMTFKLTTLLQTGAPLDKISAAGLKTHLEAEILKWGPVIKKTGVFAD